MTLFGHHPLRVNVAPSSPPTELVSKQAHLFSEYTRSLLITQMSGWEVRFSNSRQVPYFYNASTRESVWDPPAGLTPQQISSLPGADRYLQGGAGGASAPAAASASKPGQVRASHILAKHTGSRRPSSWKQVRGRGASLISLYPCYDPPLPLFHALCIPSFPHALPAMPLAPTI